MIKRALTLLVIVAVVGLAGVVLVNTVTATSHPERSLSTASVAPNGVVEVTITRVGAANGVGFVKETLPEGFEYVPDSIEVADPNPSERAGASLGPADPNNSQIVSFAVVGADSIKYEVRVGISVADGPYTFIDGVVESFGDDREIDDTIIMVVAETTEPMPDPEPDPMPMPDPMPDPMEGLRRAFSAASVLPGGNVDVTISGIEAQSGVAQVVERLPIGFTYRLNSAMVADANPGDRSGVEGVEDANDPRMVMFNLVGADSIKYTVDVDSSVSEGFKEFGGTLKGINGDTEIEEVNGIVVGAGTEPSAMGLRRTFSSTTVRQGSEIMVTIHEIGASQGVAQVVEMLPAGFTFSRGSATVVDPRSSSIAAVTGTVDSQNAQIVRFDLVGAEAIRYAVRVDAGVADDLYHFRDGVVKG